MSNKLGVYLIASVGFCKSNGIEAELSLVEVVGIGCWGRDGEGGGGVRWLREEWDLDGERRGW